MNYRIVKQEPFQLLAKVESFLNADIGDADNTVLADFRDTQREAGVFKVLSQHSTAQDVYEYGIGMVYNGSDISKRYRL